MHNMSSQTFTPSGFQVRWPSYTLTSLSPQSLQSLFIHSRDTVPPRTTVLGPFVSSSALLFPPTDSPLLFCAAPLLSFFLLYSPLSLAYPLAHSTAPPPLPPSSSDAFEQISNNGAAGARRVPRSGLIECVEEYACVRRLHSASEYECRSLCLRTSD